MGKSSKEKKSKKDKKKKRDRDRKYEEIEDASRRKAVNNAAKAQAKAEETPAERNARRLAKKQKKQQSKQADKALFGFTNEENPFGDPNLTKAFLWKKKYAKEVKAGKRVHLTKQQMREKQTDLRAEIEKVKELKVKREVEQEQMDEMRLQMERDAMREQMEGWQEKEEEFHRKQAKERSRIRINEGREKAIDILAKNLNIFDDAEDNTDLPMDLDVELTEPQKIFNGLGSRDLKELRRDIEIYVGLGSNMDYWTALLTVCDDEIGRASHSSRTAIGGLHESVQKDVHKLFGDKSLRKLEKLEEDIDSKLERGGQDQTDQGYWETLKKQLKIFKAKALLSEFHATLLKKRLRQLKEQAYKEKREKKRQREASGSDSDDDAPKKKFPEEEEDWEPDLLPLDATAVLDGEDGDLSPDLCDDDSDGEAVDAEEDRRQLEQQRRVVAEQKSAEFSNQNADVDTSEASAAAVRAAGMNRFMLSGDDMYQKEAAKPMEEMDEAFNEDVAASKTYWWHDKYRPRKPRFFNRVKTGFDWNKYNQTHYDKENPPPKIVQGYKFNIFYPDLIDPGVPPKYFIEDSPESTDHCTIRFNAGPPYEDIAFKIVKKEWEYSHKRGFKCVYDRGVLHLYFNFRRYRYRR